MYRGGGVPKPPLISRTIPGRGYPVNPYICFYLGGGVVGWHGVCYASNQYAKHPSNINIYTIKFSVLTMLLRYGVQACSVQSAKKRSRI